ncbi:MAG: prepilin-type N-terminal cleavage/methylation domain-containing protein [Opitutales bacterium]
MPLLSIPLPPKKAVSRKSKAFTLIELLMVFGVIAILAAITFGISKGVQDSQGRAKAKAELAMIAQALESFKNTHGDYPRAESDVESSADELFKALLGWKKYDSASAAFVDKTTSEVPAQGPNPYLDISKLTYVDAAEPEEFNPEITSNTKPENYRLLDPWGNPYRYYYKQSATDNNWENFGYMLYSAGPDGKDQMPGSWDGLLSPNVLNTTDSNGDAINLDNIYAGE